MTPVLSTSEERRSISPLWGLWLAFAALLGACIDGVLSGRIPYFQAVAAVFFLGMVIRLTAAALAVSPHPLAIDELKLAWASLRVVLVRVAGRRVLASG